MSNCRFGFSLPAFKNIKAKKDEVKLHKALLTLLQMLGNKMKSRLEQSLDPAYVADKLSM